MEISSNTQALQQQVSSQEIMSASLLKKALKIEQQQVSTLLEAPDGDQDAGGEQGTETVGRYLNVKA